jgi:biopolymer transport protein ExbB/TolQ
VNQRVCAPYILRAVRHACELSARRTTRKLARGLRSLGAIALTAPMLGALDLLNGTRHGIKLTQLNDGYGNIAWGWSENFVPFGMSIAVACLAMFCYGVLSSMVVNLRAETKIATLELLNDLTRPS